ncbi:MAG: hypothetical protein Q8N81_05025 [bacterium]|nr:hypothetical protein [bacterium]
MSFIGRIKAYFSGAPIPAATASVAASKFFNVRGSRLKAIGTQLLESQGQLKLYFIFDRSNNLLALCSQPATNPYIKIMKGLFSENKIYAINLSRGEIQLTAINDNISVKILGFSSMQPIAQNTVGDEKQAIIYLVTQALPQTEKKKSAAKPKA